MHRPDWRGKRKNHGTKGTARTRGHIPEAKSEHKFETQSPILSEETINDVSIPTGRFNRFKDDWAVGYIFGRSTVDGIVSCRLSKKYYSNL